MRKEDVIRVFGSASEVAKFLGISKSAVSLWGEKVPKLRQYQLRERRPTIDQELAKLPPATDAEAAA